MNKLNTKQIHEINCKLAKEVIEHRLDVLPTKQNIEYLARCIGEIETSSD